MISALFLNACGSGSSSSEEDGSTYTFEFSATLINKCGMKTPFSQVELLVQDDDWQVTQRYSTDTSGMISFTSSDEFINYTLVAKSQSGENIEGLEIVSFYQAETTSLNTYSATYDSLINNESCQCLTQDVALNHRSIETLEHAYSSLPYVTAEVVDTTNTLFKSVQVCREINADWPIASFMVIGKNTAQNLIGATNFLTSFEENDNWSLSAIEIPEEITLSANKKLRFTTSQVFANDEHFLMEITENQLSMLVFNNHPYSSESFYKLNFEQELANSNTLFSQSLLSSHRQILSSSYDEAYGTNISINEIDIDYTNFSELASDGSFDYSVAKNHPMAIIKFTYKILADSGDYYLVTWTNYAEKEGLLASSVALTGYEDIVNQDSTILKNIEVSLIRSFNTSKYNDYINYYQSHDNLSTNEQDDNDFNDNIHFYYLKHELK